MHLRVPDRCRQAGSDGGFSLVEAVVALAIATTVFLALAFALVGAAKSSLLAQQNQQAGDVLNQAVEQARALPYSALSMRETDLDANDARTPPLSAVKTYDPLTNTTGGAGGEPLVALDANGGLWPHVSTVEQNGGKYTLKRYVTVPSDASGAVYKRLTVVVQWTSLGKTRTRAYSTLVTDAKRGLPLPDFKFSNAATLSQCRNPGSVAVYSFTIKNNGARDNWSITPSTTSPPWTYFEDSNNNKAYDVGADAALPATGGLPSTGPLEPTTSKLFFAVRQLDTAAARPAPYVLTTVHRATSIAQPAYFQELTTTTTVQSAPCGGSVAAPTASPSPTGPPPLPPTQPAASCSSLTGSVTTSAPGGTMVRYYGYNPSQPGDTFTTADMPFVRDAGSPPGAVNLYNYSTNLHTVAGRKLVASGSSSLSDKATWLYGMPATSVLRGDGEVTLYATPSNGSLAAVPAFEVVLDLLEADGTTLIANINTLTYTAPSTGWQCTGMRPFSVKLVDTNGAGRTVTANQKLRLSVRVTNGVPMNLAYGTSSYPMTMTLPYKSGLG